MGEREGEGEGEREREREVYTLHHPFLMYMCGF